MDPQPSPPDKEWKPLTSFILVGVVYAIVAAVLTRWLDNPRSIFGYAFVALFLGHVAAGVVYLFAGVKNQSWSSIAIGFVERTFFFIAVANGIGGSAVAMIGWTTFKNLSYWKAFFDESNSTTVRQFQFVIMANLVSLTFAMLGGITCKNDEMHNLFYRLAQMLFVA